MSLLSSGHTIAKHIFMTSASYRFSDDIHAGTDKSAVRNGYKKLTNSDISFCLKLRDIHLTTIEDKDRQVFTFK